MPRPRASLLALALPIAPWMLHIIARAVRVDHALRIGAAAIALSLGLIVASNIAHYREPFPTLWHYAASIAILGLIATAFCGIILFIVLQILAPAVARRSGPLAKARISAAALAPLAMLIPVLVYCAFAAIDAIQPGHVGVDTGKPTWLISPELQRTAAFFGWGLIPWALLLLTIVHAAATIHMLGLLPFRDAERLCPKCYYPLANLPRHSRCPECGNLSEP